jgi:alpha,alpha-trehalose phosphorylase
MDGQVYEGHYFWDTEIHLLPFLIYTSPRIAKNLLTFRYNMLDDAEVDAWTRAADSMFVPYDEALQIIPQDDNFLDGEPWDFENTPEDRYPLLLFYHPLDIYRKQVIKQADVVLALF